MILPWAPYPILLKPNSTAAGVQLTCDGVAISQGVNGANFSSAWYGGGFTQGLIGNAAGVVATGILDRAANVRLISQAWKLSPTSTANSISGMLAVSPTAVSISDQGDIAPGVVTYFVGDSSTVAYTSTTTQTSNFAYMSVSAANYTPTTIQSRPEEVMHGVLKHKNRDYKFQQNANPLPMLTSAVNPTSTLLGNVTAVGTGNTVINFYDNDWEAVQIVGSSMTNGNSFRLEIAQCFEIELQANSTNIMLAKQPGRNNQATSVLVDAYLEKQPVALPAKQSFMDGFASFARNAIPMAGNAIGSLVGIPGLGSMASGFANMFI
jgi:hypothetical protein